MQNDLMTTAQAAEYLGVSRQRMDKLAQLGAIDRERLGEFWVYRRRDLDRWLATSTRTSGRPPKRPKLTLVKS